MLKKNLLCLSILLGIGYYNHAYAQQKENYHVNESLVKPYVLPDLMTFANGKKITTVNEWEDKRRPEILHLFLTEVYGKFPLKKMNPMVELFDSSDSALNNTAIRQQWKLTFENNGKKLVVKVLAYLPKGIQSPHVFVVPNFAGNQSIANDPNIAITPSWVWMRPNADNTGVVNYKSTEESRGKSAAAFPLDKIIGNGFGLYTFYYGDVDPDIDDYSDGVHPLFYDKGEQKPKMNEWGAISAWAWGVSRVLDIVKLNAATSRSKIIVMGHSRLGKTALWAGATDQRIDITISNNSGCVGAALSRRKFGETVEIINTRFPHWFADNFLKYSDNEDQLPIDQHMLIALIAPRPVYIASGETDAWADPKGEYLSGHFGSPVYELYGKKGLPSSELPTLNEPLHNDIGYHIRTGGHGVKDYDWEQYIKFAKMHFSK